MIVKIDQDLKAGTIYHGGMTDHMGRHHNNVTYMVLRQVTKEDYLRDCAEKHEEPGYIFSTDKFYRISID